MILLSTVEIPFVLSKIQCFILVVELKLGLYQPSLSEPGVCEHYEIFVSDYVCNFSVDDT